MNIKKLCAALSALCLAEAAFAAFSPETSIMAPPADENADWGMIHATTVTFKWAWPSGAASAQLTVVANGKSTVVSQELSDTSVSSFVWNCGIPAEDTVFDVTLAFDNSETQTAQLYSLLGSFSGAPLREIKASGVVKISQGDVIPYRSSWGGGLSGPATFSCGMGSVGLPYSSGYFLMSNKVGGQFPATLDFEIEPESPAFSRVFSGSLGFTLIVR